MSGEARYVAPPARMSSNARSVFNTYAAKDCPSFFKTGALKRNRRAGGATDVADATTKKRI